MKAFVFWLIGAAAAFGALAGGLHWRLSADPARVLVVVDSSLPMASAWDRVPRLLRAMDDGRYEIYALRSDKSAIHDYQRSLRLGAALPYGPRDFSKLAALGADADRRILVTNAAAGELSGLGGWEVVTP